MLLPIAETALSGQGSWLLEHEKWEQCLFICWQISQLSPTQISSLCFWFIHPTTYLTSPFRCLMSISGLICPKWISCFFFRLPSSVTITTIFPVVKKRKLGVCPYVSDSPHSFPSVRLQVLPYLLSKYLLTSFHLNCYHFISNHQNLSPVCCDMLLLVLPISILASLESICIHNS